MIIETVFGSEYSIQLALFIIYHVVYLFHFQLPTFIICIITLQRELSYKFLSKIKSVIA